VDFATILRRGALMYRDNIAVTFEGRQQSYAELVERACRLANGLANLGVQPGERVAVLADNQLETLEQAAGLAVGGYVRCPLYAMNPAPTHAYMLNVVGAKVCVVSGKYAADIARVRDQVPSLKDVIVVGGDGGSDRLDYGTLLSESSAQLPTLPATPDADHIIRFSAGTTGKPKGIVYSQAGWLAMGNGADQAFLHLEETDAFLVASPMSHAAGLLIWPMLAAGARHVIMPGFDPAEFFDMVEQQRCTIAVLVPTMIQMLAAIPDATRRDLSSLRLVWYGAAPINEKTLRAGLQLWGNIMCQVYGQSEVLAGTALKPRYHLTGGTERDRRILTSAGRPWPNADVTIRDEHDHILPIGQTGEICIKSAATMKGICGDPEATAARFTPDGAVRTRDMGYFDDEGFLHLVDRKEDLIISGGFNVWPLEVEQALAAHPDVEEAAVVGVPDEKWGEAIHAVVRLLQGSTATAEELIDFARERVGPVKRPKQLVITDQPLPKSIVGKLLRRQTREMYWPSS
jgi:acyl-CoA synthetase (AMP-forming)/AMP-acid ligase II